MRRTESEKEHHLDPLENLLKEIEGDLNWGTGKNWRHKDFEVLHEKIHHKTGAQISPTTLKRIWGKLSYDSSPNSYTLNTLAQFAGYESWLVYQSSKMNRQGRKVWHTSDLMHARIPLVNWKLVPTLGLLIAASSCLFLYSMVSKKGSPTITQEILDTVSFSSHAVTTGVPNTVVFTYDVRRIPSDNIQIQQNWDEKLKFPISKDQSEITSTYYYPGYWKAKLVVDDQVIMEEDVYVKSEGWLITIYDEPIPRYIKPSELLENGTLGIKDSIQAIINLQKDGPPIAIHQYVDDFGQLDGDNFSLDISLQNTYDEGDGVCQFTQIFLDCTKGRFCIPLSRIGCVGDIFVRLNDLYITGQNSDLSNFGTHFEDWQKLKLIVQKKKVKIYLNQSLIYQNQFEEDVGTLAGIRVYFTGSGAIDEVKLNNAEGQLVFMEEF